MKLTLTTSLLIALSSAHDTDTTHSHTMGTASFLWPSPRPWTDAADNTPPCGSTAGPSNRTSFPLTNGRLALVSQDDTRTVSIGVSYSSNPTSLEDFTQFLNPEQFGDLEVGHTCIKTADPPVGVLAGSNATWMVRYTDEESGEVEFACADVVFVEAQTFGERIPCFDATRESEGPEVDGGVNATTLAADGSEAHPESDHGDKGLAGGAIAGIVVGVLAGVAVLVVLGFFLWRRGKKPKGLQPVMVQTKDVERAESDVSSR